MERRGIPREGAIAYGHPIDSSGSMLTASLTHQLQQAGLNYGIVGTSSAGGWAIMALWKR